MAIPRHLLFFDTETFQDELDSDNTRQRFRMGWAVYYRRPYGRHKEKTTWLFFDNVFRFWDFVFGHTEAKEKLWCIARNVVFDFTVAGGWAALKKEEYKLRFFHSKGCTTIISVRKKGASLIFLDSMNWFVESLEKTGKRIGLPKLKIDFATCTDSELKVYCRRDVEIELENFKLFIKFLVGNKVSRLCYTRGSTAMAAYLLRHYNKPIYIHNNREAILLERDSYKGGRVECFHIGELTHGPYYTVDVNSLYPTVMRDNHYPTKYEKIIHDVPVKSLRAYLKCYAVAARVQVNTDEAVYAVRRDRTVFPVGRFLTALSTPEIKYALAHGHIEKVQDAVIYEQEECFRSFVETFYALRMDFKSAGVVEYEKICKVMLNSLYGKFGQKGENWELIGDAPDEPDREELTFLNNPRRVMRLRYLLGQVFELKGYSECFDSFPAIAAHVTAYGRMRLWSLMQTAGTGNYFYCDTDSLIVNDAGLDNLRSTLHDTELGGLKVEEVSDRVTIRGLKDYVTAGKTVIKGIRKAAVKIKDGVYKQEMWPGMAGLLKKGKADEYVVTTVVKHLNREYHKGTVTESGEVVPLTLCERP